MPFRGGEIGTWLLAGNHHEAQTRSGRNGILQHQWQGPRPVRRAWPVGVGSSAREDAWRWPIAKQKARAKTAPSASYAMQPVEMIDFCNFVFVTLLTGRHEVAVPTVHVQPLKGEGSRWFRTGRV